MKTTDYLEVRHYHKDPERGAAVERGLRLIADAPALWMTEDRATRHIERRLRGFDKCGKDAFYRPYDHKNHGPSYHWAYMPCNEAGHENCCFWTAKRDLSTWAKNFREHYRPGEFVIADFSCPGEGPLVIRERFGLLKKRRPLQRILGKTIGYMTATSSGYSVQLLVRKADLDLLGLASADWMGLSGPDASIKILQVDPRTDAIEGAAELKCRAEQALALLVDAGSLLPEKALSYLEEELRKNRVVFGPGFQKKSPAKAASGAKSEENQQGAAFSPNDIDGTLAQNSAADAATREEPWGPCQVCHDPACGERQSETYPVLPFSSIESLLARGVLKKGPTDKILIVAKPELLPRLRRPRVNDLRF